MQFSVTIDKGKEKQEQQIEAAERCPYFGRIKYLNTFIAIITRVPPALAQKIDPLAEKGVKGGGEDDRTPKKKTLM